MTRKDSHASGGSGNNFSLAVFVTKKTMIVKKYKKKGRVTT